MHFHCDLEPVLMSVATKRATRGTFESDVKDAKLVSTWGVMAWRAQVPAGTKVEVLTRSGNTKTPDEAWSEWSAPYTNAEGSPITSPKARYIQWRAVLTGTAGAAPTLTSLSSSYLPRNIRPQVSSITFILPVSCSRSVSSGETEIAGGWDAQDERASPASPRPTSAAEISSVCAFKWKADERTTTSWRDVFYRREGDTTWRHSG